MPTKTDLHENQDPISGKAALVTGGARRVGRAIALRLAQAGMDVAITYHKSGAEAKSLVREVEGLGRRGLAIRADFSRPDAAERVFERFTARFEGLYALVNNASFFTPSPIGSVDAAAFQRNLAVHALAPLLLIQRFAPMLAAHERPGRVVNLVDIHVLGEPLVGYVTYNASKAALLEITMTAAMELAPKVTVNALAPGVVAWPDSYSRKERREYLRRVPLRRPGTPEDAAAAALFLIRDADYTTGQVLRLDGGRLLT